MGRYGLGRGQRGAHRAESTGNGALATVGQVLGSTVPKRVPPPKPLRVLVVSGVLVALVLFSYSTTQIYLRFAEPDRGGLGPGAAEDGSSTQPSPEPEGGRTPPSTASGRAEAAAEDDEDEPDAEDEEEETAQESTPASTPVPVSGPSEAQVSYQTIIHNSEEFMGLVTITNNSDSHLEGWELRLSFSDVRVLAAWEAEWEATSDGLVARQPSWAGGIAPGQSVAVNFTARGGEPTPDSCSLNGSPCGF